MKNPFEIIFEKLNNIEKAIKNLRAKATNDNEVLLNRVENYELLKTNYSTIYKHTKTCKSSSYRIGNSVNYKKSTAA